MRLTCKPETHTHTHTSLTYTLDAYEYHNMSCVLTTQWTDVFMLGLSGLSTIIVVLSGFMHRLFITIFLFLGLAVAVKASIGTVIKDRSSPILPNQCLKASL